MRERIFLVGFILLFSWSTIMGKSNNKQDTVAQMSLMPYPTKIAVKSGKYRIEKDFQVSIQGMGTMRLQNAVTRFFKRLDNKAGLFFTYPAWSQTTSKFQIISQRKGKLELDEDESYQLKISSGKIELTSENDLGALHGLETLLQLLKSDDQGYYFPAIEIEDTPRFPWRGLMIDVARHFQPMAVIKRNIDGLAAVKMNVLHLHLCDDQGFRIESKIYPQLQERASDGQYFSQKDIKEIVAYADDRGIRVVPEFDVPGHASSWLVAFPELASAPGPYAIERYFGIFDPTLNPILPKTYEVLDSLFGEMAALFPDKFFHIGGDENEGRQWDENPEIQKFMKMNEIKNNHELQSYFSKKVQQILQKHGKMMIGWDEIMQPDLPKTAVIHSWRGQKGLVEAAEKGYKTILSNGYYIDLMHPAEKHYLNDPLPEGNGLSEEKQNNVLGGEATMWSELVTSINIDSRIWPKTAAIAERLWSPAYINDVNNMYDRLDDISLELEQLGLTHITSREVILRNLTGNRNVEPLKTLANVAEPMKGYNRNAQGKLYTTHSPFTLFADACIADAPDARTFKNLVANYLQDNRTVTRDQITSWLKKWNQNYDKLKPIIDQCPVISPVLPLSYNLSEISRIGLESMERSSASLSMQEELSWYRDALQIIKNSRTQSARTELQIVDAIEKLVKNEAAIIQASRMKDIEVDGNLDEWEAAAWNYFVPLNHKYWHYWKDTCHFAIKWDDKNLYMAFKVQNKNLQALAKSRDQEGLHMDDGIEFLINPNDDHSANWQEDDIAYHVNVFNTILDEKGFNHRGEFNNTWNGNARTAVKALGTINNNKDKDQGYVVEVAISWKELGIRPNIGTTLGIDVCVNDRYDSNGEYRYYDYMNLNVFHNSKGFAKLVLIEKNIDDQTSFE